MAHELFDHIRPWFDEAFGVLAEDLDDLSWALSLTTLPDPARQGQFVSVVTLYSQLPTGKGSEHLANTVLMSPGFTKADVLENIRDLLANFRSTLFETKVADEVKRQQPDLADLGKTNGRS